MDRYEDSIVDDIIRLASDINDLATELDGYRKGKIYQTHTAQTENVKKNLKIIPFRSRAGPDNTYSNTTNGFKAAEKEESNLPLTYTDGSWRFRDGCYEYRFQFFDKEIKKLVTKSVYGNTLEICFSKRNAIEHGKYKTKFQNKPAKEKLWANRHFKEWIRHWFNLYRASNTEKTKIDQLKDIERRIIPQLGNIVLKKLDGLALQEFINSQDQTKTNKLNKIADILNSCLQKAADIGLIQLNPFKSVIVPTHIAQSYPAIQPADQCRLFKLIKNKKYLLLYRFCCCVGLRISEALGIKIRHDIDFKRKIIIIRLHDTRTKKHRREVPFLDELFSDFDLSHETLFPGVTQNAASQFFRKLFRENKIDAVIHSFRHTFVSCAYHVGFKEKQIQVWAGHKSILMTMNTYTTLLDGDDSPILQYLRRLKEAVGQ